MTLTNRYSLTSGLAALAIMAEALTFAKPANSLKNADSVLGQVDLMARLFLKIKTSHTDFILNAEGQNTAEVNELIEIGKSHVRAAGILKGQRKVKK